MTETRVFAVSEETHAGEVRRAAAALARSNDFDESTASNLAIVVTELATNLVGHGGGGEILLTVSDEPSPVGIDILAVDRGRGMRDTELCMRDGFSTGSTPGNGLGAVSRLADEFDLHSEPGKGTVVFARISRDRAAAPEPLQYAGVRVPVKGETECGDAWSINSADRHATFLVADGLGHGAFAAAASREAVRVFRESDGEAPADLMQAMHAALRSTRGAAAGVARIELDSGAVQFCGVGNTSFVLNGSEQVQQMVSHNGTLGHQASRFQEFTYRWDSGSVLVMHSDGLATSWQLARYPGLLRRHPGVIAGVLYRDFRRMRDDVTVLAARIAKENV